jgi:hypothetical protein
MENKFETPPNYDAHLEKADIDAAFKKAEKVLSDPINPEDFRDIYGDKNVDSDIQYVEKAEEFFRKKFDQDSDVEQQMHKLGKIFEAIIFQHAELSNWFGENATTIETSRFDDIKNGVDTLVEFEEGNSSSHLALAIDVTSSSSTRKKFERIESEINEGHLAEIKYFVSEHMGTLRGHKANVPRVVIGADRKTVCNVINTWIEGDNKALAEHPIQIKILSEIKIQLSAFQEYCQNTGKDELADIYQKGLAIIEGIIAQKNITEENMQDLDLDDVYRGIKAYATNIANRGK